MAGRSEALLSALAILGDHATLERAARLADLEVANAHRLLGELIDRGEVTEGRTLAVSDPAIVEQLPAGTRLRLQGAAVDALLEEGAPPETVADLLVDMPSRGRRADGEILFRAARAAAARHESARARALFERALIEPMDPNVRESVEVDLGLIEAGLGTGSGERRLRAVVASATSPTARARAAIGLARNFTGRGTDAAIMTALRQVLDELDEADRETRLLVAAEAVLAAMFHESASRQASALRDELEVECAAAASPGERMGLAAVTMHAFRRNEPAASVAGLARKALGDGRLVTEEPPGLAHVYNLAAVLAACGEPQTALDVAARMSERAAQTGSTFERALALAVEVRARHVLGDLPGVLNTMHALREAVGDGPWTVLRHKGVEFEALALVDRGETEAARAALVEALSVQPPTIDLEMYAPYAQAWVHLDCHEPQAALDMARRAGEAQQSAGIEFHPVAPWQLPAAVALAGLGRIDEARGEAAAGLVAAERFAEPRARSQALRIGARLLPPKRACEQLLQAQELLDGSPAKLERARVSLELGAALRRLRRAAQAREPLRLAAALAGECGARRVAEMAHAELAAAGGRSIPRALSELNALTATERRVATLAASGRSNPQIAQELVVSRKTVEKHLAAAYRKLGIASRSELPSSLEGAKE